MFFSLYSHVCFFFFNDTATTEIYTYCHTLSLHDALPIYLRLFRHRNFAAGTIALVLAYAAFFAVALIIPLWLQRNLGYTAIWAGLATAPIGVLPVLLTPLVGKYATRFDLRIIASLAFIVRIGRAACRERVCQFV